ncbi:MAG: HD domain-containing protein, partial [Christensenellaceae bacterium]|nr:HD domain-containing protein [Christensenellaceae bacterium]
LGIVIPELLPMRMNQKNPHHVYTVLEHSAAAVEAIPAEPSLRLAALLHDIGKPACFFTDEDGIGHFYGHPAVSAELAEKILSRLKLDNATKERVVTLVKYHDIMIENTEKSIKRILNRFSPEVFFQLLDLKRADCRAQHPDYAFRLPYYDELQTLAERILAEKQCFSLHDLAVNGRDLLALGYKGKEIGITLDELLEKVISGELPNEKDILLKSTEKR